ncbi:hypothetical protein HU200_040864 [Digitaria exilis]|uniref:Disease resistance R13L4/SHOC-2-like LRR domain-containing protein n=1 Tax=Digitaria exilis TaxID=1010633 RepID=A0A835B869_9POAL|nr:hypothetical protein HU200_040864 [Digitaria exilis]
MGADVRLLPEHLEKLAGLPSLRFLRLQFDVYEEQEKLIISYGAFPCLTDLVFQCGLGQLRLKFQHRAMQKLQRLCIQFGVGSNSGPFESINNFDYGLKNLPSLRHVVLHRSVRNSPDAQYAIRKAINSHPNHPVLSFV